MAAVVQHHLSLAQAGHGLARGHDASDVRVTRHAREREPGFPAGKAGELGTRAHHRVEGLDQQLVGAEAIGADLLLLHLHRLRRGKDDPAVASSHLGTQLRGLRELYSSWVMILVGVKELPDARHSRR